MIEPSSKRREPIWITLVEAFGWGVLGGVAVGSSAVYGLWLARNLYPPRYTQFPIEVLFLPLGFGLGFLSAGTLRLGRPHWTAMQMLALVAALTLGYGAIVLSWGRSNARPAVVVLTFDPNPATAVPCTPATCPEATPPLQWSIQGVLHVEETTGLGGTIDAIEVTSHSFRGRQFIAGSVQGPNVRYTARQLGGPARVRSHEVASYPFHYAYRTTGGESQRTVSVFVQFTDGAGHWAGGGGQWAVR